MTLYSSSKPQGCTHSGQNTHTVSGVYTHLWINYSKQTNLFHFFLVHDSQMNTGLETLRIGTRLKLCSLFLSNDFCGLDEKMIQTLVHVQYRDAKILHAESYPDINVCRRCQYSNYFKNDRIKSLQGFLRKCQRVKNTNINKQTNESINKQMDKLY